MVNRYRWMERGGIFFFIFSLLFPFFLLSCLFLTWCFSVRINFSVLCCFLSFYFVFFALVQNCHISSYCFACSIGVTGEFCVCILTIFLLGHCLSKFGFFLCMLALQSFGPVWRFIDPWQHSCLKGVRYLS